VEEMSFVAFVCYVACQVCPGYEVGRCDDSGVDYGPESLSAAQFSISKVTGHPVLAGVVVSHVRAIGQIAGKVLMQVSASWSLSNEDGEIPNRDAGRSRGRARARNPRYLRGVSVVLKGSLCERCVLTQFVVGGVDLLDLTLLHLFDFFRYLFLDALGHGIKPTI
jgi:hypothetical protein